MTNEPTAGPWKVWRLAPDSDEQERCIITTADGETEICGIVRNEADGPILAASREMMEALECQCDLDGAFYEKNLPLSLQLKWKCRFEEFFPGSAVIGTIFDLHLLAKELRRHAIAKSKGEDK